MYSFRINVCMYVFIVVELMYVCMYSCRINVCMCVFLVVAADQDSSRCDSVEGSPGPVRPVRAERDEPAAHHLQRHPAVRFRRPPRPPARAARPGGERREHHEAVLLRGDVSRSPVQVRLTPHILILHPLYIYYMYHFPYLLLLLLLLLLL